MDSSCGEAVRFSTLKGPGGVRSGHCYNGNTESWTFNGGCFFLLECKFLTCGNHMDLNLLAQEHHGSHCLHRYVEGSP